MPKLDEAKERLMTLRFWLGIIVAAILNTSTWIFNNYDTSDVKVLCFAGFSVIMLIFALFFVSKKIDKKCKDIGNLKK